MIELQVLDNDIIQLMTTTPPVDGVISVNGKQGVVTLTAEDIEGNSVPTNVRQAILALFEAGAYAQTGLTDEIAIVESWAEQVTSLSISPTTLSLSNNTPQTITATVVPSGSTVSWSSSDTSVATVVAGVVTGVYNGSCTITASAGGISKTCAVTVSGFATLESISAVYTQSGTVYDTDSLDSFKADLVVTATYSDTSTETVPSADYVLSGTLEVGTSTITVAYGGKTTTFTVTVSSEKPSQYTWLYDYTDGLLSAQNYVTESITGSASATLQSDSLRLESTKSSSTNYIAYDFTDTTTSNAKITMKAKFTGMALVNTNNTSGAGGFRLQLSNGTNGAQAFFTTADLSTLNLMYFEGSTQKRINLTGYDPTEYHIVELELSNGHQIITIDGTEIVNSTTLSSYFCTVNRIMNQQGSVDGTNTITDIKWLAYYEVA